MGGGVRGVKNFSLLNHKLGENAAVDHNKGATAFVKNFTWGAPNRRGTSYSLSREGDIL